MHCRSMFSMFDRSTAGTPGGTGVSPTRKKYVAAVRGDGRVMPITEMLGRRRLREIDPLTTTGRRLLASGRVTLCYGNGRIERATIQDVLDRLLSITAQRRAAHPDLQPWASHHDRILESIERERNRLKAAH